MDIIYNRLGYKVSNEDRGKYGKPEAYKNINSSEMGKKVCK